MKFLPLIVPFTIILFFCSCGGVIGHIEKYRFNNTSIASLKSAIERVYVKHPEHKDFDSNRYFEGQGIGDGDYYCTLTDNRQKYLFVYAFPQYPAPNDTIVEIALTTAGVYGQDLPLAR